MKIYIFILHQSPVRRKCFKKQNYFLTLLNGLLKIFLWAILQTKCINIALLENLFLTFSFVPSHLNSFLVFYTHVISTYKIFSTLRLQTTMTNSTLTFLKKNKTFLLVKGLKCFVFCKLLCDVYKWEELNLFWIEKYYKNFAYFLTTNQTSSL